MTTTDAADGESIDIEDDRLQLLLYDAVDLEEVDARMRSEHAGMELSDLLDSTAEVALSPKNVVRLFVDGETEIDGAGYLGATLRLSPEQATDLGYRPLQAGRDAHERQRDD